MPDNREYLIPTWSGRVMTARKHHRCENCGGIIVIGTKYQRDVIRMGVLVGKDPRRNVHYHLDCQAPWYQPNPVHRFKHVGKLPGSLPPADVAKPDVPYLTPAVTSVSNHTGVVQWKLPEGVAKRLAHCPTPDTVMGAVAEFEQVLTIVLEAVVAASGHQRVAMRLSHLVNEMAQLAHATGHLNTE